MPRTARIVAVGTPHHITQRGNNKQQVFFNPEDYKMYLHYLNEESKENSLLIDGYCLMPNHVHLIATPQTKESLSKTLGRTNFRYAQYFNGAYDRHGHLWQGRFYSCPLDSEHFVYAMRYVEQNPVRSGLARAAWWYKWSSAGVHVGKKATNDLVYMERWHGMMTHENWEHLLETGLEENILSKLRSGTNKGKPVGSADFIREVEQSV